MLDSVGKVVSQIRESSSTPSTAISSGTAIPELEPAFLYSDFCNGTIWALDLAGARTLTLLDGFDSVVAIRVGPDGEPYVLERSGTMHRLIPG